MEKAHGWKCTNRGYLLSLLSMSLEEQINLLFDLIEPARTAENLGLLRDFRGALNRGEIRVAEPCAGGWKVNVWVKKGLLLHLKMGVLSEVPFEAAANAPGEGNKCFELDTFPVRRFLLEDGIRLPPGGTYIRDGAYLAPGVTCMPPVFVNMGARAGAGSVLDSHSMVGLCAQIGERVHIGPGSQIGGMVIPFESLPVIIADDVSVGGCCGIFGSVEIGCGAVLSPGTMLTADSPVYDATRKEFLRPGENGLLSIPPAAIVMPGACPFSPAGGEFSPLMLQAAVITSYRTSSGLGAASPPPGFPAGAFNGSAENR
ncbi:MAG: 2,3,4,5-tetrahydropyridine-2,6-dicarboxylate N-succinyltransferase [Terriglobia bacterium]